MQQLGLAAGGELAEQVGGVVGLHLVEHPRQPLRVEPLDELDLLVLGQLLEQIGEPLVLQLGGQHPPAAQRQAADRLAPSRPDAARRARPPGGRPSGRRRTARRPRSSRSPPGLAAARGRAAGERDRRDLPAGAAPGAGVSPMSTTRSPLNRLPISSPASSRSPSRSSNWRMLTEPRRSRAPSLPISPIRPMPTNTRRRCTATTNPLTRGGLEPRSTTAVDDATDLGAVGAQQRQSGQPRHVDDSTFHTLDRTPRAFIDQWKSAPAGVGLRPWRARSGPRLGLLRHHHDLGRSRASRLLIPAAARRARAPDGAPARRSMLAAASSASIGEAVDSRAGASAGSSNSQLVAVAGVNHGPPRS